jgi:hypothetical protein
MKRLLPILLVGLCLGGFAYVAGGALRARAASGRGMPAYSVFSTDEHGLADAFRVVRRFGYEPVALTVPIQNARRRGVLFVVEPEETSTVAGQGSELTDADAQAMLRWASEGNTLVLCSHDNTALHALLHAQIEQDPEATRAHILSDAEVDKTSGYTRGIDRLTVEGRDTVQAETGLPLWWVHDQPGALLFAQGQGRVLLVADPSLLTRDGLARADNGLFLYNVCRLDAADGQVLFDEYHHGLGSDSGLWAYLRERGLHWTLLPTLVVVAVGCWAGAVRLGPARILRPLRRADAVDYASAVARIYERAGVRKILARIAMRGFMGTLTRHLRLRRTALPVEILATWKKRHPDTSASESSRVENLLRAVMALRQADYTTRQLLTWTRAFDQFSQEVSSGR